MLGYSPVREASGQPGLRLHCLLPLSVTPITMLSQLSSHAGELKSKGAVEAAGNSGSKVAAENAEHVLLDESQKGGAVAFQFDSNASPQAKAAQAHTVRSCSFSLLENLVTNVFGSIGSTPRLSSRQKTSGRQCGHGHGGYKRIAFGTWQY